MPTTLTRRRKMGEVRLFDEADDVEIIDPIAAARKAEDESWHSMPKADFNCGVVQEIVNGQVRPAKFNVMVFYAHSHIIGKYPRHFRAFKKFSPQSTTRPPARGHLAFLVKFTQSFVLRWTQSASAGQLPTSLERNARRPNP
jgi:hypothetical protein